MKWKNDEYKDLKFKIFDLLKEHLSNEDARNLMVDIACSSIDELINKCKKR
jgi:hypothetical protein